MFFAVGTFFGIALTLCFCYFSFKESIRRETEADIRWEAANKEYKKAVEVLEALREERLAINKMKKDLLQTWNKMVLKGKQFFPQDFKECEILE